MRKLRSQSRKSISARSSAILELMERRVLFSTVTWADDSVVVKTEMATPDGYSSPGGAPITPALMRDAYGLGTYNASSVTFNGVQGTGAGQTIAIVEGGSDPDIAADLTAFDSYWGLPAPPSLTQLNATGGTSLPAVGDVGELDLDVEWAHVMAPQASIALYDGNLYTAMTTASNAPGVCAISISYTISGTEGISEFSTPSGHTGVTFLSAAGDTGAEVNDPAKSPAVVAVGGTDLTVKNNAYYSETGWDASGGGVNTGEAQPTYQNGTVSAFSTTNRVIPDVALDADPGTGVAVYDEYDNGTTTPWSAIIGGTSLSTPLMAGIVAVTDQGRVAAGLTAMDGYTQTLPRLYNLYTANAATNFHDITTGNNGHAAGVGYDEVTGIGSPMANNLIPDLAGADTITGRAYIDTNGNGTYDAGVDTPLANKTVYLDLGGTGAQTITDPTATTDANGLYTFTDVIGSWTGKVRLAGSSDYLPENNTTVTTAYDTTQNYDLVFSSGTTYTATASPTTVTATTSSLGITISGTAAANLTYTWSATTEPYGSAPTFSPNGTASANSSTVTFNMAGTYVLTAQISDGSGHTTTTSVTVTVNQTLTSLAITPVTPNITGDTTQQLTVTALDQFGNALTTQPTTFTWSITSGGGSINSSTGLYTAPATGTVANIKVVDGSFSTTDQVYVVSSPWASADIGSPTEIGTAFDSAGVFNVSGGGAGVTGTSDQFHYVYRALGGDGTIIARVASQTNSNASAGAGVMIRDSLGATSQEISMGLTPTGGAIFSSRSTTAGTLTSSTFTGISAPYYVKLVRSGNTITGYYSSNGTTWTTASSATVAMTGSIYIGMYDTAHTSSTTSTATFDNISLMVAANDTLTATAGAVASLNVLSNDVGPAGTTLSITSVTQGTEGTVTIGSGGVLNYSTSAISAGTDSFTYTISDGVGDTATATVTVNILGLEAYYKLNEGSGTTTADASGNGVTATITNATWTTGVAGDGLAFNGSSAYVTVPALNISTNTVTFSGWFYSSGTQVSSSGLIFNRNGTAGNGLDIYAGSTATLGYTWGTSAGTYNFNSGLKLPTNTWTFAALVITPTNATIYMEPFGGSLTSASNTLANPAQTFSTAILIGQDSSSTSRTFNGSLDEIRIYNTNLSSSAIAAIASRSSLLSAATDTVTAYDGVPGTVNVLANDSGPIGSTLTVTGFTQPTNGTLVNNGNGSFTYSTTSLYSGTDTFTYTLSDGLGDTTTGTVNVIVLGMIDYLKFDEGTGLTSADATGDGYTATLNNTAWTSGMTGLSTDHALVFNGTSSSVTFANSPSLNGTTNFSVGAWVKTTAATSGVIVQQRDVNGYQGEYQLATNSNGTVTFWLYNNGYQFDFTTTTKVNDGNWHQVTGVRNGTTGSIYIDGTLAGSASGTILSLTSSITVGIGADIRSSNSFFNGTIDDVMISNDALSPAALATISNAGPAITTAAAATPAQITTNNTALSVSASDFYEALTNLTYTWAVTSKPTGATTPTFSVNGTNAANASTATFYAAGNYTLSVTVKDANNRSVTSSVNVTVAQFNTTTTVVSSNPTSTYSLPVTFTATVTPAYGTGATGTVQFTVDGVNSGNPVAVSNNTASYTIATLSAGAHTIGAIYSGDANFNTSTSSTITQMVNSTLDLKNGSLNVTGGSLATIFSQVQLGYANGTWTGAGIYSSTAAADSTHLTALGIMQNNASGTALYTATNPFHGSTPGAGDVLIAYTYYGDANLDGKVDGTDYSRIDNGALNHLTGWYNGDFNYDGVINGSDYTLIDNSYNMQRASLAAQIAQPGSQFPAPAPANTAVTQIFTSDNDNALLKKKTRLFNGNRRLPGGA